MDISGFMGGILASLVAAGGTAIGAVFLFVRRRWSVQQQILMLASAAGVMLGATFFSLLLPALDILRERQGNLQGVLNTAFWVAIGAVTVSAVNQWIPHHHEAKGREGPESKYGRNTLFILAIAIHNVPEGLSVGVASGVDFTQGLPVLLGITAQNLPEGFAVAAALLTDGARRGTAVGIGALTGMAEVLGGIVGSAAVGLGEVMVPFCYAFAAGAMLFIISGEVIPETHARGRENSATHALVIGFVGMMILTVLLE